MSNKKHSTASNSKGMQKDSMVNNTEGAHMPNANSASGKTSEKDVRAAFASDSKKSDAKKSK